MINVALSWHRIDWDPDETWRKTTLRKLSTVGIKKESDLDRSVYALRLNGNFCIQYPGGQSPTVYIGEGNFRQRINAHRSWVTELEELVGDFSFQVCVAMPRVRNSPEAYRDCEAALIKRFAHHYGSAPMWNKQFERRIHPSHVYSERQMDQALCKRSGAKYKWAVAPMKSSGFFDNYVRTHIPV